MSSPMRALATAVIYFGTFLTLGYVAKRVLDRWMAHHGEELHEVQTQGGNGGRKGESFLLGAWYK
jgi:hypothetical protein